MDLMYLSEFLLRRTSMEWTLQYTHNMEAESSLLGLILAPYSWNTKRKRGGCLDHMSLQNW